jgi:hypothetical protein
MPGSCAQVGSMEGWGTGGLIGFAKHFLALKVITQAAY